MLAHWEELLPDLLRAVAAQLAATAQAHVEVLLEVRPAAHSTVLASWKSIHQ
jgi:hypothetical protein